MNIKDETPSISDTLHSIEELVEESPASEPKNEQYYVKMASIVGRIQNASDTDDRLKDGITSAKVVEASVTISKHLSKNLLLRNSIGKFILKH